MSLSVDYPSYKVFDIASGEASGTATLSDDLFGLEPREDILQRVIRWQLAKKHDGTKKTLGRADVNRTGAKMYKQKGTGRARHSSASAPQFRGGGKAFGGFCKQAESDLPKKVVALGLRIALSTKAKAGQLMIVGDLQLPEYRTKLARAALRRLGLGDEKCLIVHGADLGVNFSMGVRNLQDVDILPAGGLNVYDILNHTMLVLSCGALEVLDARFGTSTDLEIRPYQKHVTTVPSAPRKGSKPVLPRGKSLTPQTAAIPVPSFPLRDSSDLALEILFGLSSTDKNRRKVAMAELNDVGFKGFNQSDLKARLLPILFSDDLKEAERAAIALVSATFPGHYPSTEERRLAHQEPDPSVVRRDLEDMLRDEGIVCFTYAEQISNTGNHVVIQVRLSKELPFKLAGKPARVENPEWPPESTKFDVIVSGDASIEDVEWTDRSASDHARGIVHCHLPHHPGRRKLNIDFFANDRWIGRRELSV